MSQPQGNIDVFCAEHNYGDQPCQIGTAAHQIILDSQESEYEFRERIYDATQAASDLCKSDSQVRVIRVDWSNRSIETVGRFSNLKGAYEFVEQQDNGDPHYIIGADIEDL